MAKVAKQDSGLLDISRLHGQLHVRKRKEPYRTQLLAVVAFFTVVSLLFSAYILAMYHRPNLWVFVLLIGVVVLALVERAWELRRVSQRDEVFRFDKDEDRFERNGEVLAPVSEIDHVLIRQIRQEEEGEERAEYALVVALENTRRFTIAETMGVPGAKREIEHAAQEIAEYAGVKVEQGSRSMAEWWMDK